MQFSPTLPQAVAVPGLGLRHRGPEEGPGGYQRTEDLTGKLHIQELSQSF